MEPEVVDQLGQAHNVRHLRLRLGRHLVDKAHDGPHVTPVLRLEERRDRSGRRSRALARIGSSIAVLTKHAVTYDDVAGPVLAVADEDTRRTDGDVVDVREGSAWPMQIVQNDPALGLEGGQHLTRSTLTVKASSPGVETLLLGSKDATRFFYLTFEAPDLLFRPTTDYHRPLPPIATDQVGKTGVALKSAQIVAR